MYVECPPVVPWARPKCIIQGTNAMKMPKTPCKALDRAYYAITVTETWPCSFGCRVGKKKRRERKRKKRGKKWK